MLEQQSNQMPDKLQKLETISKDFLQLAPPPPPPKKILNRKVPYSRKQPNNGTNTCMPDKKKKKRKTKKNIPPPPPIGNNKFWNSNWESFKRTHPKCKRGRETKRRLYNQMKRAKGVGWGSEEIQFDGMHTLLL